MRAATPHSLIYRVNWKTRKEELIVARDTIVVNGDGSIGVLKAGQRFSADMPLDGSMRVEVLESRGDQPRVSLSSETPNSVDGVREE